MVDLTINKEDKKYYIIDIDEDRDNYAVLYADGKNELFGKSEAIREELLEKLERQFWNFSQEYKVYAKYEKKIIVFSGILFYGIFEVCLLSLECDVSSAFLNLYVLLMKSFSGSLASIGFLLTTLWEIFSLDEKLSKIHIIEVFLKHKEDFEVLLYKFNNGDEIKYSPVDLMNIDNFNSLEEICDFVDQAEKEIKLEKIY